MENKNYININSLNSNNQNNIKIEKNLYVTKDLTFASIMSHIKNVFPGIINHVLDYPTPASLSYFWGFGSLAGVFLGIQIVTGIILAMHYVPNIELAFLSVEHIMRDVSYGWFIRYLHANGASMFFIVVYIHIGRGLYYGYYMYPRNLIWVSGIIIFFLMMATAFIGYVLPWGQMSFWGATVITNLFSAIPVIGESIVFWIWGGFSVNNATLNRFFSLHYLLPFIIAVVVLIHIYLLHFVGSNNPLGIDCEGGLDKISFYPYFYVKDLFGFFLFLLLYLFFVFYYPNFLGHSDNYIEANPMVTPSHIVPEWYFLPFYAVLRAIPDKLGGVIFMGLAIAILAILPYATNSHYCDIRSNLFRPNMKKIYWLFVFNFFALGWIGSQPASDISFILLSRICTFIYFVLIFVIVFINKFSNLDYKKLIFLFIERIKGGYVDMQKINSDLSVKQRIKGVLFYFYPLFIIYMAYFNYPIFDFIICILAYGLILYIFTVFYEEETIVGGILCLSAFFFLLLYYFFFINYKYPDLTIISILFYIVRFLGPLLILYPCSQYISKNSDKLFFFNKNFWDKMKNNDIL